MYVIFPQMSNPGNECLIFQLVSKDGDIYENMIKVQEKSKETKTRIYLIRSDVCPPFHYCRYVELFDIWFLDIFFLEFVQKHRFQPR